VSETPTVTVLLIDRSLGNRGCVAHNFFVICTEPQLWYQGRSYAYYACTVRTHRVDAGVDRLIVTFQRVFVDIHGIVGLKQPEKLTLRVLRESGSTLDVRLAPCKSG
jgi:hypothetical protein